jgi:hypothetical protein
MGQHTVPSIWLLGTVVKDNMQVRGPPTVLTITARTANEACFSDKGFNQRLSQLAQFCDCSNQSMIQRHMDLNIFAFLQ